MCPNFCMIYYLENAELAECMTYGHSRYKPRTGMGKNLVAYKKLRYFPTTPKLQRLFMSPRIAEHMTWHQSHNTVDRVMVHGHALNISRLVNTEECKLYGMKSHDCHVFMQTLIPLDFRDLLSKVIWDAFMEINHFFRDICSSKLNVDHIERLKTNIIETICKLEIIFPPFFS